MGKGTQEGFLGGPATGMQVCSEGPSLTDHIFAHLQDPRPPSHVEVGMKKWWERISQESCYVGRGTATGRSSDKGVREV